MLWTFEIWNKTTKGGLSFEKVWEITIGGFWTSQYVDLNSKKSWMGWSDMTDYVIDVLTLVVSDMTD